MKIIKLTRNKETKVDDALFDYLNKFTWSFGKRYAVTAILPRGTLLYLHHLVLPIPAGYVSDHIDGDTLNNQRSNLRIASFSQNAQNRKIRSDNTSGYKGVSWFPLRNKWRASIYVDKKQKLIGLFDSPLEAAIAYNEKAKLHFGEFAKLNQV